MKIVQLIQKKQLRGAEIFACQLSNHLISAGHDVTVLSLFPGEAVLPFKGDIIELRRPSVRRLVDFGGWKALAMQIRDLNPEIVQANAGDTLKYAVISKLVFSWKARIIFRNANKVSDFVNSWPKKVFNKFLVGSIDHVISVSESCREDFVSTYDFSKKRITTIPIGIETVRIDDRTPVDLTGLYARGKIVVHIGSFVPEKNHAGLLRIVRILLDRGEAIHAILVGDGRLRKSIESQIAELNLGGNVHVVGYRSDVLSLLSNARALLLPSRIEGLPGVILEAMYCRTPVIAYDVGGIGEVVRTDETGWLVPYGNEVAFAKAVQMALGTNTADLIETAYNMVVDKYRNEVIASRFAAVYQNVLLTSSRPAN